MSAVATLLAMLVQLAMILTVFRVVERARRTREGTIACQIAMTDAIHRDLGAVVAPTVTRSLFGGWRVRVPVPFERPGVVGRVAEIARDTVAPAAALGGDTWEIVLVPQAALLARAGRAGSRHAFEGAPRVIPAGYGRSGGPGARTLFN